VAGFAQDLQLLVAVIPDLPSGDVARVANVKLAFAITSAPALPSGGVETLKPPLLPGRAPVLLRKLGSRNPFALLLYFMRFF